MQTWGVSFPIGHYDSIVNEVSLLKKIDFVLELDDYIKIFRLIQQVNEILNFFNEESYSEDFPLLYSISEQIFFDSKLLKEFQRIFSEDGKIQASASVELKKIFSLISSKERELDKVFSSIISRSKQAGHLTDNLESYKNSRRVLSVNAESKRKIKGIIHDESATGKTVFIEPEEIVQLNNDLFELEVEKRKEVYNILKALSQFLRPFVEDFLLWEKIIIRYDIIRAKANFGNTYNGQRPKISEGVELELFNMYHPLLLLINQEFKKKTIPCDLSLNSEKRILLISGPNAGGKSICLKSFGLNQLMLQCGLLIPVSDHSTFTLFNKIMIDIGDQQSIEGDLSTYSSRLIHMKHFVSEAKKKTLVLMDEFGSGSDPKIGGAIAEAVLDNLVRIKCYGLITTHYSNIKNYAYDSPSIENGAMLFDKHLLKPTYQLKIGQPGSSFAFEIANKIGLPDSILEYAKNKAGKHTNTVDSLLVDLQQEKKELERRIKKAADEESKLKTLISNYESLKDELNIRRKKLKLEAKQQQFQLMNEDEREIQKLIRDLKKEKNLDKAGNLQKKIKEGKKSSKDEMQSLSEEVFKIELEKVKDLRIGQYVKLRNGSEIGMVVNFDEKKVKIEMGLMQFEVARTEVFLADQPIETKSKTINTDTAINPYALESKLDIRGYSKQEALDSIKEFLDNALMSNIPQLQILHGKGTGVLRKALWKKAKEYKDIKKIWHPKEDYGAQGITWISF